jgi:hypothetical protein
MNAVGSYAKAFENRRQTARQRFTLDGSQELENRLAALCAEVAEGIRKRIPSQRLEGIVLGGGYGRGQGGVLQTANGEAPYNDMEFYVFLHGEPCLNEFRFGAPLRELSDELSALAGLHIEFKVSSLTNLRRAPISMFSYDLVAGHRIIAGGEHLLGGCRHHLHPADIPIFEAARLLFNRCSGLLMAREYLCRGHLAPYEFDFVGRNLAKAELALGDALLAVFGEYHGDCRERHARLVRLRISEMPLWLDDVQEHHARGVSFKLRPSCVDLPEAQLRTGHARISALAERVWLWLESRRLECSYTTARQYALSPLPKCPETAAWRNYLLNLKTFGICAAFEPQSARYPRERLFNTFPVLLWDDPSGDETLGRHVRRQLHTKSKDWAGMVAAYKRIWPSYG